MMLQKAVHDLHIQPENLLHIGDRVSTDGFGAKEFGAKFMYIGSRDDISEITVVSDYMCKDLTEALNLLKDLLPTGN